MSTAAGIVCGRIRARIALTQSARPDDNSGMDGTPGKRCGGGAVVVAVAALVLLPVLYALSVGPAVALYDNGMIGQSWEPALQVFYTPLEWCVELVPGAEPLFDRYMSLWETPSPVPMPVTTPAPAPAPYGS